MLVTTHRRESFGAPLRSTCAAIVDLVGRYPDIEVVLPVHPNPNVKEAVESILCDTPRVHLIAPVDYVEFVHLMARSYLILTDSGGVQEEAPSLARPCLVTRNDTERPEAVEAGTAKLVGTERERIVFESLRLLDDAEHYAAMSRAHNPYGDGKANQRILEILRSAEAAK